MGLFYQNLKNRKTSGSLEPLKKPNQNNSERKRLHTVPFYYSIDIKTSLRKILGPFDCRKEKSTLCEKFKYSLDQEQHLGRPKATCKVIELVDCL